jgi:hypothetical protein
MYYTTRKGNTLIMQQPPNDPTQPSQPPYTHYPPQGYPSYPPPPYQQPQPKPKKRRTWLWIVLGIVALAIFYQIGNAALSQTPTTTTPQATTAPSGNTPAATQPPAATQAPTKPPTWTSVQTFKGSGSKKTQTFTVGDNWRLKWTCDPASFGGSSFNVIIEVDNADGSYADLPVNTMCKPGNTSDTSYEATGGTYLLNVTSEGDWSIEIQVQK